MRLKRLGILLLASEMLIACTSLRPATPSLVPRASTQPPTPTPTAGDGTILACYYVWATQELPALSQTVQNDVQAVAGGASGSAYAYGEDCVSADGTRKFTPMETDFRMRLPVDDLTNEQHLGDLIGAVMHMVEQIPPDQLAGPQPGRVEFEFYTASAGSLRLTVDIDRFRREAGGITGAPLFRLFYAVP